MDWLQFWESAKTEAWGMTLFRILSGGVLATVYLLYEQTGSFDDIHILRFWRQLLLRIQPAR
jgi:peptidoglycan/LPS O-acetylase OafA/YrhL